MKRITDEELAAIRERAEKATEGPWECVKSPFIKTPKRSFVINGTAYDDTIFIAHAREDIPKLLAEIEYLRGRLSEAMEILETDTELIDRAFVEIARLDHAISRGVSCGECTNQLAEDWEITASGRFLCRECIEYGGDSE